MSTATPSAKPCPHCSSMIESSSGEFDGQPAQLGPLPSITELASGNRWVTGAAAHYRRLCSCARAANRDGAAPRKAGAVSVAVVSTGITLFGGAMPSAADYYAEAYGSGSTSYGSFDNGSTYDEIPTVAATPTIKSYPATPPPSVSNPPQPTAPTKSYPDNPPPSVAATAPTLTPTKERNPNEATDDDRTPPVVQTVAPIQPVAPPPPSPQPTPTPAQGPTSRPAPAPIPTPTPTPSPTYDPVPVPDPDSDPGRDSDPGPAPAPVSDPAPSPRTRALPNTPPPSVAPPTPGADASGHGYDEVPLPSVQRPDADASGPPEDRSDDDATPGPRPDDGPASRPMQFAPPKQDDDRPKQSPGEELSDSHQGTHFEPTPGAEYVDGIDGFLRLTGEHGRYILETWESGGGVVGPKGAETDLPYRWFNDPESKNFELFQEFAYHHDMQATDAFAQGDGAAFTAANAGSALDGMVVLMTTGDLDAALALTSAEFGLFGFTVKDRYQPVAAPTVADDGPTQPTGPLVELSPQVATSTDSAPAKADPAPLQSPVNDDPPTITTQSSTPVAAPPSADRSSSDDPVPVPPRMPTRVDVEPNETTAVSPPSPAAIERDEPPVDPDHKPRLAERQAAPAPPTASEPKVEVEEAEDTAEEVEDTVKVDVERPVELDDLIEIEDEDTVEIEDEVEDEEDEEAEDAVEVETGDSGVEEEDTADGQDVLPDQVVAGQTASGEDRATPPAVDSSPDGPDASTLVSAAATPVTVELETGSRTGHLVGEVTADGDVRLIVLAEDGTTIVVLTVPPPGYDE